MKYIVIGLGNFGSTLSMALTAMGHEVIGVDKDMQKVNHFKDKITHTVCLDSGDLHAMSSLPIKDTDSVIIAIGEDFGASVLSTALLKQLGAKHLLSRSISELHQTVIEAIGVDQVVRPEQESAERLALGLSKKGVVDSFKISSDFSIVEVTLPDFYFGKTIEEAQFRRRFNVNAVTIVRKREYTNLLGNKHKKLEAIGVLDPKIKMEPGDILVLFGKVEDINKVIDTKW
jgi:trk system potassium uptake protein